MNQNEIIELCEKAGWKDVQSGPPNGGAYWRGINPDNGRVERIDVENLRLRAIFPKICQALDNGACCSINSSIEFLELIPKEIERVLVKAGIRKSFYLD